MDPSAKDLHIETPLIYSFPLSQLLDRQVYLKLDNLQPSGSFKIRGIGRTCQEAVKNAENCRLVGSSGGNAGLAMAHAAEQLNVPLTLFIPKTAPEVIVEKLKGYHSVDLRVTGENWDSANAAAQELLDGNPDAFFVHPFDQQTTWDGHSTIVEEICSDFGSKGLEKPAAVVTCVGGGGLAVGILQGLCQVGWDDVPLVCVETSGADCLNQSLLAGERVQLDAITSIAKSLGALSVAPELWKWCQKLQKEKKKKIVSRVISDKQAVEACIGFAKDHRMLVEPACGASLAFAYAKMELEDVPSTGPIVIIVCGGNMATLDLLEKWREQFDL